MDDEGDDDEEDSRSREYLVLSLLTAVVCLLKYDIVVSFKGRDGGDMHNKK